MVGCSVPVCKPFGYDAPQTVIPAFQAVSKRHPSEAQTPGIVIPAKQAVSKPLSLWERVAEGRVRAPNNPAAPIHCR